MILLLSVPSCPMFLAIIKLETVVAEPSITRIAIICSSLKPRATARGMNTPTSANSLIKLASNVGFILFTALAKSKVAPMDISPSGVARPPTLEIIEPINLGTGSFRSDHIRPQKIPIRIGFLAIPMSVFLNSSFCTSSELLSCVSTKNC